MSITYPLIVALAVGRITRLITGDFIFLKPRRWVQARVSDSLAYLVGCPWCASIYVAAALVWIPVVWPTNRVVFTVAAVFAASYVTGWLSLWDDADAEPVADDDESEQ